MGQSVYILADRYGDDVVLTLEAKDEAMNTSGLTSIKTEAGDTVYYKASDRYKLVTFKHNGRLYTMTCRYEMSTLMELSEKILKKL